MCYGKGSLLSAQRETRSQLTWWQIPSGISEAVRIIDSEAAVTLVNQSALA